MWAGPKAIAQLRRTSSEPPSVSFVREPTVAKVARAFRVGRYALWKWQVAHRQGEDGALVTKQIPGRPPRLSDRQLMRLVFYLAKGPEAYGFRGQVWTLPRIANVIEREFGVRYTER